MQKRTIPVLAATLVLGGGSAALAANGVPHVFGSGGVEVRRVLVACFVVGLILGMLHG